MHLPHSLAGRRWLEIALDYRCNLRCLGCHSCHGGLGAGERLASSEAMALLRSGRDHGIDSLWLGGGEPTLRDDLLSLVRAARGLGYARVTLQTNGMRLSYGEYRTALLAAGVTDVRLNVKSHRADVHDWLSGGVSCHALLLEALAGLVGAGMPVTADVLLTRDTVDDLAQTVSFFGSRGVGAFTLWLLSTADRADQEVASQVPRIRDLLQSLSAARLEGRRLGVGLTSLHTPPCTLPAELRELYTPASSLSLVVAGPEGRPFALESSPFEGGAYLEACEGCSERSRCGGPRADYRRLHGDDEFAALRAPGSPHPPS